MTEEHESIPPPVPGSVAAEARGADCWMQFCYQDISPHYNGKHVIYLEISVISYRILDGLGCRETMAQQSVFFSLSDGLHVPVR